MESGNKAIGIFSGSFNPVHNGHISIARSFLSSEFISSLWILLTPDPPHKNEKALAGYHHRYEMLKLAFGDWDRVIISDIETKLPKPSYTLQTLEYLQSQYPDNRFYLCVGGDSARNFTKWHKWENILSGTKLLVAKRKNESLNLNKRVAKHAHVIEHEPIAISSTEIRNKISTGEDISDLVPKKVREYIKEHNLYKIGNDG